MTAEEQDLVDRAMVQLTLLAQTQSTALFQMGDPTAADSSRAAMRESLEHANHARRLLRSAGARIPSLDDKPREERYDLAELAAVDSYAGKNLLAGLNELQGFADAYDRERGKSLPSGQYNVLPSGTDFGEALEQLRSRLRQLLGMGVGSGRE